VKKVTVALLVLAMVGSVMAGFFFYSSPAKPTEDDPFADVPAPSIKSLKFADASGQDISSADLSKAADPETLSFDGGTKWPAADKMPKDFSPDKLMEQGKYVGLGLRGLHDSGITGKGVSVAVIDKPVSKDHEEYRANIQYTEVMPGDPKMAELNFHGAAVAGILAGKDGVAPGARLYYFAIPDDDQPYARYTEAMNKLLELNATLSSSEKIRVVLVAAGVDPVDAASNLGGAGDWTSAIEKAKDAGIVVVYPGMPELDFTGAGCLPSKDRDDPANYEIWTWIAAKADVARKLNDASANSWESARAELIRLLTKQPDLYPLQAEAINTFIYLLEVYKTSMAFDAWLATVQGDVSKSLAFPADYITVASVDSDTSYAYYGSGGLTWASPYAAGLLALGLQVKPSATPEELFEALAGTGTVFATGGKLVNPTGFIQALK
jgi:subtilisin family serine protease